jgi:hypothetical protein
LTMVIAGPHRNQQRSKRRRSFSDGVFWPRIFCADSSRNDFVFILATSM